MATNKKNKKRTRNLLLSLGGGFVLVIVLVAIFGNRDRAGETEVEVATAEIRTITQTVTASGRVQPEVQVRISPDVSGEIINLPVIEGQEVSRGQLLARIRPDFYSAQVEQSEAAVQQARSGSAQATADLALAETELERQKQLFESNVIAEGEYQQFKTRYEIAQATLDAADFSVASSEARLRQAEEDLRKTTLYSPMDGTVSQLNVELGERVVGTTQMAGTELMIIAPLEQMELEVEVNENDVVNVTLGDTADVEIDAFPDRIFKGVVTEIALSARLMPGASQDQVTNFPVKIRILDRHNVEDTEGVSQTTTLAGDMPAVIETFPSFRPGMSGTVDIYTNKVPEVVAVPIQAVTVRDFNQVRREQARLAAMRGSVEDSMGVQRKPSDNDSPNPRVEGEDLQRAVFLLGEGGFARIVTVETGIADDRFIEIRSGLEGGEQVIIGPYSAVSRELKVGTPVKQREGSGFDSR